MARKELCEACRRRRWCQEHHVVWEQHGGDDDPRNLIWLCLECHYGYHLRSRRVPAGRLPDEALDYAFERLGPYAYDYLRRRYPGDDPRLEPRLAAAEEATERLPPPGLPGFK